MYPLLLTLLLFSLLSLTTTAQNTTTTTTTTTTAPITSITKIVSLFYLNDRAFEDLPLPYTIHTSLHRISGRVIATDPQLNLTTYAVTKTHSSPRRPLFGSSGSSSGNPPLLPPWARTLTSSHPPPYPTERPPWWRPNFNDRNGTGQPTTITQGPATFMFTGSRGWHSGQSIVNKCSLNGTAEAACNLTHVGDAWYTGDKEWNGTWSTYSYNWTSGDRFGFVPVTITQGAEMLVGLLEADGGVRPSGGSSSSGGGRIKGDLVAVVMGVVIFVGVLGM
ncbi:hypothetical protein B0T21DRAFT_437985 [Apiosordaria backusii]|uniref:Uncharacterized protein n=1 Tax=Apiosordaria backusii TaxID=314023 RepID=A0AA40BMR2_9PEZI|nr:hypothetical protein B0T21DRAFT_437985 [Apiosordaria backusii]